MKRMYIMILVLIGCFGMAGLANANSPSYTLSPIKEVEEGRGYYLDKVERGEEREYTFIVRNLKDEPLNLSLYPADAKPAQNGGRSFSEKGVQPVLTGSWIIEQELQEVNLQAHEERSFTYKLQVPADLQPGQYVAVVAAEELIKAEESQQQAQEAALAIDVVNRTGVQVVLEYKPEESEHAMSIDEFHHDYTASGNSRLSIKLSNRGTILEKPTGTILVRDSHNEVMFKSDYVADSIYGGTTADMVYLVADKLLLPDTYSVYYEANFSDRTIERTFFFTVSKEEATQSKELLVDSGKIQINQTFEDWLKENSLIIVMVILLFLVIIVIMVCLTVALSRKKKENTETKTQIEEEQPGAGSL